MSTGRGQSYAEELRQQYRAALRQLPRRHQQQQQPAASGCDEDDQSITTTSTSTTTTTAVTGSCWRWCQRRGSDDDGATSLGGRLCGLGSVRAGRGLGRGGHWAAADCESIGSCSDFTTPTMTSHTGACGESVASVPSVNQQTGPPTTSLPDVVILSQTNKPADGREQRRRSTVKIKEDPPQALTNVSHSDRYPQRCRALIHSWS